MSPSLITLLLLAATVVWHRQAQAQATPTPMVCPHCGDLVQRLPLWPVRCPACQHWI